MKIKTLMTRANRCKTDEDAQKLLDMLKQAFSKNRALSHLYTYNEEAYMEDSAFACFEFNREISDDYVTMIKPQIRDSEVSVFVVTNRMLDGLGMMSQHWEAVEDMDDLIECEPDRTVSDIAQRTVELAISQHRMLIESVGVPQVIAEETAKKCW